MPRAALMSPPGPGQVEKLILANPALPAQQASQTLLTPLPDPNPPGGMLLSPVLRVSSLLRKGHVASLNLSGAGRRALGWGSRSPSLSVVGATPGAGALDATRARPERLRAGGAAAGVRSAGLPASPGPRSR